MRETKIVRTANEREIFEQRDIRNYFLLKKKTATIFNGIIQVMQSEMQLQW